jgi:hypothetical protein
MLIFIDLAECIHLARLVYLDSPLQDLKTFSALLEKYKVALYWCLYKIHHLKLVFPNLGKTYHPVLKILMICWESQCPRTNPYEATTSACFLDQIRNIKHIDLAQTRKRNSSGLSFCQHIRWHSPSKRRSLLMRSIEINVRSTNRPNIKIVLD